MLRYLKIDRFPLWTKTIRLVIVKYSFSYKIGDNLVTFYLSCAYKFLTNVAY